MLFRSVISNVFDAIPSGKPFTVSNKLSSISHSNKSSHPDPLNPEDPIILVLSGVTCAHGGDPTLNGIIDDGSLKSCSMKEKVAYENNQMLRGLVNW